MADAVGCSDRQFNYVRNSSCCFQRVHRRSRHIPTCCCLWEILGVAIVLAVAQSFWPPLRQWMRHMWPIFTGAILLIGIWDVITSRFPLASAALLSRPGGGVTQFDQRSRDFCLTAHGTRFVLLQWLHARRYPGIVSGVCIGWSSPVRYWGMPLLKVVGPIPATAWIPLAMVVAPSAIMSAAGIDRTRRVVPGHDVDCVWHFQYSRVLS